MLGFMTPSRRDVRKHYAFVMHELEKLSVEHWGISLVRVLRLYRQLGWRSHMGGIRSIWWIGVFIAYINEGCLRSTKTRILRQGYGPELFSILCCVSKHRTIMADVRHYEWMPHMFPFIMKHKLWRFAKPYASNSPLDNERAYWNSFGEDSDRLYDALQRGYESVLLKALDRVYIITKSKMAYQLIHPIVGRDIASIITSYNVDNDEVDYVVDDFLDYLRNMNGGYRFLSFPVFQICQVNRSRGWVRKAGNLMEISNRGYGAIANEDTELQCNLNMLMRTEEWLRGSPLMYQMLYHVWLTVHIPENHEPNLNISLNEAMSWLDGFEDFYEG